MTDRDPGAPDDPTAPDDGSFEDAEYPEELDEGYPDEEAPGEGGSDATAGDLLTTGAARGRPGPGGATPRRAGPTGPSVAERAVHLEDRPSAVFVLGVLVVFVGILLYGIFAGNGGIITGTPTPTPSPVETPAPTDTPSPAPSASPSASPSAPASGSPAASGSSAPSGSPSASPKASPSASLSPSPSAS